MYKKKQHHFDKLQKSSILFTQLGLVLALFIVYLAFEFSIEKKDLISAESFIQDEPTPYTTPYPVGVIEEKVAPKDPVKLKKIIPLVEIKIDDTNSNTMESVIDPIDIIPITDLIGSIIEVPDDDIDDEETLPFTAIEEIPIYPGCEGLDEETSKKCFSTKISKFVNKRFDINLAERLNVSGKQRIWVEFTIDKTGKVVDIAANSPHKSLIKEAVRVVEKLPQMTPGKQRKRPVGVKYTLPIVFSIE